MTKPPIITNRKPADELAWLREQIKDLQDREDYIKRMMLKGTYELEGDEVNVVIVERSQMRLDRKQLAAEIGPLDRFMKENTYQVCQIKKREEDEQTQTAA